MMSKEELQEIKCLRAVLERILRVMDEGLFVDYQMEKFGRIKYTVAEYIDLWKQSQKDKTLEMIWKKLKKEASEQ
jgi:hypothetical protein